MKPSLERSLARAARNPESRVFHTPPLLHLERGELSLALDPEAPAWLSTNAAGAAVLRLADGRRTVGEISASLSARWAVPAEQVAEDVARFLEEASEAGIASLSPYVRPPYAGRAQAIAPGRLAELYVFVTNDCNLRCTHCYVSSGDLVPPDELTTEELLRLVDQARDLGVQRFYFTGGEPMMRHDIFALIERVCPKSELVILTNATYFNPTVRARLAEARVHANGPAGGGAPRRLHFQVSLDGPDAALHERIRGERTFDRTVAGISALVAVDLTPAVSTAVTAHNVDRMAEVTRLLARLGVKEHHLLWMQEGGRANDHGDLAASPAKVSACMREVSAVAAELGMIIDNEASHRVRVRGKRGRKTDLCNCGYESLNVFSDGQVYPCVWFAGAPGLACGSIRERTLSEIWHTSPILQSIRDNSVQRRDGCSECPVKFLCGGGTNCSSYFHSLATQAHGSIHAAEPFCETLMDMTTDLLWEQATPRGSAASSSPEYAAPVVFRTMEGQGAQCSRPHTHALERGIEVGTFHCSCVLQADVEEGRKGQAWARTAAERAGDLVNRDGDLVATAAAAATARRVHLPLAAPAKASADVGFSPSFDEVFDGIGQTCVDLLMPLAKRVKAMPAGAVVKVVTDDVAAREDLGAWCRMTGHELLAVEDHERYATYYVKRGARPGGAGGT